MRQNVVLVRSCFLFIHVSVCVFKSHSPLFHWNGPRCSKSIKAFTWTPSWPNYHNCIFVRCKVMPVSFHCVARANKFTGREVLLQNCVPHESAVWSAWNMYRWHVCRQVTTFVAGWALLCSVVQNTASQDDGAAALWPHPQLRVKAVEAALQFPNGCVQKERQKIEDFADEHNWIGVCRLVR